MVTFFSSVVSPVFTAITLVVRVPVDSTLTRPMSPLSQRIDSPAPFSPSSSSGPVSDVTMALSGRDSPSTRSILDGLHLYAVGRRRISRSHRRREHCPQQNTGKEEGKHPYPHLLFHGKSLLCSLGKQGTGRVCPSPAFQHDSRLRSGRIPLNRTLRNDKTSVCQELARCRLPLSHRSGLFLSLLPSHVRSCSYRWRNRW